MTKSASFRVDQPSPVIRALAQRLVAGATTPEARALACFRFVRDEIHFGFTPRFDIASAEETLVFGRGHCNPQAILFASLLHAAGVEMRLHLVRISNEILAGIFPPPAGRRKWVSLQRVARERATGVEPAMSSLGSCLYAGPCKARGPSR